MKQTPIISPSLLAADFARLGEEATKVIEAGAQMLHIDVMDNHFVPNLTYGTIVLKSLTHYGITVPYDVHLMVTPVDHLIANFARAGADTISIHAEATDDIQGELKRIRDYGCKAGLAINPETPLTIAESLLEHIDLLLVMSVNPGFGGQAFNPDVLHKIKEARDLIDDTALPIRLEVDGGINLDTIKSVADAGGDTFVAGTAIFGSKDYKTTISKMLQIIS